MVFGGGRLYAALPIHRLDLGPVLNTGGVSGLGEGSGGLNIQPGH